MVCDPADNSLNPANLGPPPNIVGFGLPFAPPQIPFPDVSIPPGIPEDLLDLLDQIFARMPGGIFRPNVDNFSRDIWDLLASLLNQLAPYLALYNFFQALLNLILCILDVICAIPSPFRMFRAARRLFKRCLPDFLNLFPWMALIAMILALLLLLLALIEYLINLIRAYIEQIIRNLQILAEAIQLNDEESVLAGVQKIAYLLCLIEQAFAILIAFQAILSIIEILSRISGRSVCGKGPSVTGDDPECCTDDVCPPFIDQNPDGLVGTQGRLIYHRTLMNNIVGLGIPLVLPPLRDERWQFVDAETGKPFNFSDIVTPINDNIFFPEQEFNANSSVRKVPYILDMELIVDPVDFGHSGDTEGSRKFMIKDCIVVRKPLANHFLNADDSQNTSINTGTLFIEGGKVFEEDGSAFLVGGFQANLNNFIHLAPETITPPIVSEDAVNILDISYTLRINHEALFDHDIITLGCQPAISLETTLLNNLQDFRSIFDKIDFDNMPDVGFSATDAGATGAGRSGTIGCLEEAMERFRADVSPENALVFQADVEACLGNLRDETSNMYNSVLAAGVDVFASDVSLDTDLQFINAPITITVILNDASGNILSRNIPEASQPVIAAKLNAEVSFGTVSDFSYNNTDGFIATIISTKEGSGEVTVSFEGSTFSQILNRDLDDIPTEIVENVLTYQFVSSAVTEADDVETVRRDEKDIAGS